MREREGEIERESDSDDAHIHDLVCVQALVGHMFSSTVQHSVAVVHSLHSLNVYLEHYNPLTCAISFRQQCQQQNNLA